MERMIKILMENIKFETLARIKHHSEFPVISRKLSKNFRTAGDLLKLLHEDELSELKKKLEMPEDCTFSDFEKRFDCSKLDGITLEKILDKNGRDCLKCFRIENGIVLDIKDASASSRLEDGETMEFIKPLTNEDKEYCKKMGIYIRKFDSIQHLCLNFGQRDKIFDQKGNEVEGYIRILPYGIVIKEDMGTAYAHLDEGKTWEHKSELTLSDVGLCNINGIGIDTDCFEREKFVDAFLAYTGKNY